MTLHEDINKMKQMMGVESDNKNIELFLRFIRIPRIERLLEDIIDEKLNVSSDQVDDFCQKYPKTEIYMKIMIHVSLYNLYRRHFGDLNTDNDDEVTEAIRKAAPYAVKKYGEKIMKWRNDLCSK